MLKFKYAMQACGQTQLAQGFLALQQVADHASGVLHSGRARAAAGQARFLFGYRFFKDKCHKALGVERLEIHLGTQLD